MRIGPPWVVYIKVMYSTTGAGNSFLGGDGILGMSGWLNLRVVSSIPALGLQLTSKQNIQNSSDNKKHVLKGEGK